MTEAVRSLVVKFPLADSIALGMDVSRPMIVPCVRLYHRREQECLFVEKCVGNTYVVRT